MSFILWKKPVMDFLANRMFTQEPGSDDELSWYTHWLTWSPRLSLEQGLGPGVCFLVLTNVDLSVMGQRPMSFFIDIYRYFKNGYLCICMTLCKQY